MTVSVRPRREPGALTCRGDRRFRPDIQGLRAVAVVLVVLYHCGVPGVGGGYVGVDVFFVISGFLITRHLITEQAATGRISLGDFYARRIRRLLPAALTVILMTQVVTRVWGPPLQGAPVARDGIFSTFYLMNVRLAAEGVDYQNAGGPVSPLQHFWSLAVEEQFYILWPLAIMVTGVIFRRRVGRAVGGLALGVVLLSFLLSVGITRHSAVLAYFSIQTRGWELGVGALVAVATPVLLRIPAVCAVVAGWGGLLLILWSAVAYSSRTPFPGSAAAVPVAGAALVVLAGLTARTGGIDTLLRRRGMQFAGEMSYGWYLWHWPLIVLAPALLGATFGWPENLAAALIGLALAVLSTLSIERMAARSRAGRRRWFRFAVIMSLTVTTVSVVIIVTPPAGLDNAGPGAALDLRDADPVRLAGLLDDAYASPRVPSNLSPSLLDAVDDLPPTSSDGCNVGFLVTTEPPCRFGDPSGRRTVVLFGDSHAEQWFGALDALARAKGWLLVSWTKAACPMADVLLMSAQLQRPFRECPQWRADTVQKIAALHPDLVIASGSDALPGPGFSNASWSSDTVTVLGRLGQAARQVVYLADVPAPTSDVPVCLATHLRATGICQFSRASQTDGLTQDNQFPGRHTAVVDAAERLGVAVVDPTDWFCSTTGCPVVLQDTLIYRDATHMTQSYSRALEPMLGRALARVVPWMST